MVGRPINESRKLAVLIGDKTYIGSVHGCGTNERYVKGGGCVHCARWTASSQRTALREKQQQQAIGDSVKEVLDTAPEPSYSQPWD